jgi:hypothetical protein
MQSFGRSMGLLKTHKYKTQADLINLKPEEIIRIPLTDFGNYIETETGNVTLDENQTKALRRLLLFKKTIPNNGKVPEKMIDDFLDTLPNVKKMAADYKDETKSQLNLQSLQRRHDALNDRLPEPVTLEESLKRRWVKLGGKTRGKRRKYKSKRNNRKTKQSQKRKTKQSRKRVRTINKSFLL